MEYVFYYASPLGGITVTGSGEALTGLRFCTPGEPSAPFGKDLDGSNLPVFRQTKAWLDAYFGGSDPGFTPPLELRGTPFRKAVWELLLTLPYGRTATYGAIAQTLAAQKGIKKMAAQAPGASSVQ